MKFHYPNIIFIVLLCLSPVLSASELTAVERLAGQFQLMNSLNAHFDQKIKDSRGELLQQASGTLTVKRPRQFYWRTEEPYQHLVVTDGKLLWLYDIDLEQITRDIFSADLDKAPALLLSGEIDGISDQYTIDYQAIEDGSRQFILIPKNSDSLFQVLTITFSDDGLQAMSLKDSFDQLTEIQFTEVILNPEVADQLFQFMPPDGIDVINNEP